MKTVRPISSTTVITGENNQRNKKHFASTKWNHRVPLSTIFREWSLDDKVASGVDNKLLMLKFLKLKLLPGTVTTNLNQAAKMIRAT